MPQSAMPLRPGRHKYTCLHHLAFAAHSNEGCLARTPEGTHAAARLRVCMLTVSVVTACLTAVRPQGSMLDQQAVEYAMRHAWCAPLWRLRDVQQVDSYPTWCHRARRFPSSINHRDELPDLRLDVAVGGHRRLQPCSHEDMAQKRSFRCGRTAAEPRLMELHQSLHRGVWSRVPGNHNTRDR